MPALTPFVSSPLAHWNALLSEAAELLPLAGLDPDRYACGHAAFEARSTQRALVTDWLKDRLAQRAGDLSMLSVGCGDGVVDAELARAAVAFGRTVRYAGLDPHPASAGRFLASVGDVDGVLASATVGGAEQVASEQSYDVVLCVHSLYYVDDLPATLLRLWRLVRPGGELLVVLAPLGELNALTAALAPPVDGRRQWWSADLADALVEVGLDAEQQSLHGTLSLEDCFERDDEQGRLTVDFAVQAVLTDALRDRVLEHLLAVRLPGPGLSIDHPVDIWTMHGPRAAEPA